MNEPIVFDAIIAKVTTLADKGLRVTFDLPETAILAASELMALYQADVVLSVRCEQKQG